MTENINAEPNLDEMSLDEIKAYQDKLLSGEAETVESKEESKDGQTAEVVGEAISEQEAEANSLKPEFTEEQKQDFNSPYLKGKSIEEVKRIIQTQQEYITQKALAAEELEKIFESNVKSAGQLGNTLGNYKKMIEGTQGQSHQPVEGENDPLDLYDPETVKATEILVDRLLAQKQQKTIQQMEEIRLNNMQYVENLKQNPELYKVVEPELLRQVNENPNIKYQPGWVQNETFKILNYAIASKTIPTTDKAKVIERKRQASTISGGATPSKPSKSVDDMSAGEYLEYLKTKGLAKVQ